MFFFVFYQIRLEIRYKRVHYEILYCDKLNYCSLSAIASFLSLSFSLCLVGRRKRGRQRNKERKRRACVTRERVAGCYGWVSPRLSGLRLSKHTNRPPSLLLLRGAAWVYPSVKRAGLRGGASEGRRDRGEREEK